MYVQFHVNSTSDGARGLREAFRAVATAAAGSTPAQPVGCSVWNVVDNTVAGGWTPTTQHTALGSTAAWSGSRVELVCNKAYKTNQYKIFGLLFNTSANYSNAYYAYTHFYEGLPNHAGGTGSSTLRANITLTRNATNNTSTNWAAGLKPTTSYIYDTSQYRLFHLLCTEDYLWFWYTVPDSQGLQNNFAGFSDLDHVPDSLMSTGNGWFPSVAMFSASDQLSYMFQNSSTPYYFDFFASSTSGTYPSAYTNAFSYQNATWQYTQSNVTNQVGFANGGPLRFGPGIANGVASYYGTNNTFERPSFNADGDIVGTLSPVVFYNPFCNIPYQTVKGICYYEPSQRANSSGGGYNYPWHLRFGGYIYDQAGAKWSLQPQSIGSGGFGIRAFKVN